MRRTRVVARQRIGDVLVREPVKAVPAHAAIGDRPGQRERLRDGRRAVVKRRVEAGDLRQFRRAREQRPDRRQVVRLVQRRKRDVLFERGQDRRIDADGLRVLDSAVHHAVADAGQAVLGERRAHSRDQMVERAVVTELDSFAPGLLREDLSRAVLGDEARRRVQPLGLPARDQFVLVTALGERSRT